MVTLWTLCDSLTGLLGVLMFETHVNSTAAPTYLHVVVVVEISLSSSDKTENNMSCVSGWCMDGG